MPCFKYALLFCVVFVSLTGLAHADCTSPAGIAGATYYDTTDNVVNFCDGINWRMTGAAIASAATTGCTNPTGTEGQVIYNNTYNVAQFCNGDDWVNMGPENASAGTTGCTNPTGTERQMVYNTSAGWLQYCDGDNWVNAGQLYSSSAPVCASGFVFIPGSAGVDSQTKGWCVSKYEMTPWDTTGWGTSYSGYRYDQKGSDATVAAKSGQTPINTISRNEAATQCSSDLVDADGNTVSDGKLLTVELWNLLATDITNVGQNWSSGVVGTGYMSRGFADNDPANAIATGSDSFPATDNMGSPDTCGGGVCTGEYWSRTYKTSRGELIWDLAGNVWEWFDDLHGDDGTEAWQDFTNGTYSYNGISLEPANTSWNYTQGVGRIYDGDGATVGSTYAAPFGGNWSNGTNAGVWTSNWHAYSPSSARNYHIGFRCIAPAQ